MIKKSEIEAIVDNLNKDKPAGYKKIYTRVKDDYAGLSQKQVRLIKSKAVQKKRDEPPEGGSMVGVPSMCVKEQPNKQKKNIEQFEVKMVEHLLTEPLQGPSTSSMDRNTLHSQEKHHSGERLLGSSKCANEHDRINSQNSETIEPSLNIRIKEEVNLDQQTSSMIDGGSLSYREWTVTHKGRFYKCKFTVEDITNNPQEDLPYDENNVSESLTKDILDNVSGEVSRHLNDNLNYEVISSGDSISGDVNSYLGEDITMVQPNICL